MLRGILRVGMRAVMYSAAVLVVSWSVVMGGLLAWAASASPAVPAAPGAVLPNLRAVEVRHQPCQAPQWVDAELVQTLWTPGAPFPVNPKRRVSRCLAGTSVQAWKPGTDIVYRLEVDGQPAGAPLYTHEDAR